MKLSHQEREKRFVYNNFLDYFSLTLEAKNHLGCRLALPKASFPLFNAILLTDIDSKNSVNVIQAIKSHYQENNRKCCWWVTDFAQPQDLKEILIKEGFERQNAFSGMIFDLSQKIVIPSALENIEIKTIESAQELSAWIKPLEIVFGIDEESGQYCEHMLKHYLNDKRFKHYYIEQNAQMVATASLFIENGVSGFYNMAVLPDYRGQKLATALKWFRLKVSQDLGAKFAILQSSSQGQKLDKSIGFKPVLDFVPYIFG